MRNAWEILQAFACLALLASPSSAELLVHYTFDGLSSSIVPDSAPASGNNSASIVGNVGIGIPGVLGDAIRLPNDDGASYVRLPSSLNPAPNANDERTIAFLFNQEEVGAENKMFGYGTGQQGRSFDVSLEGGGIRLRYSGGNVTWGSGFDFTGIDSGFHHLAIRVPGGAFDYLDVEVLLDGVALAGVATGGNPESTFINTGGGVATELNLGRSPVFSPAGDFIGLMDDFRIYDHALTDAEIQALIPAAPTLTLEVDPTTGLTAIRNLSNEAINLDYYEIESTTPMLNASSWSELESQSRANFPVGTGSGDGWEVLGTADAFSLVEAFLLGESSLAPGEWINLGKAVTAGSAGEFTFTYGSGETFVEGQVVLAPTLATADFDRDGQVDGVDLSQWRSVYATSGTADADGDGRSEGNDFLSWQRQRVTSVTVATYVVPEPNNLLLLGILSVASFKSRQRFLFSRSC